MKRTARPVVSGSDRLNVGTVSEMTIEIIITFLVRLSLVLLFLPFSALDKVINFSGAVGQAEESFSSKIVASILICIGIFIEIFMSLGILTGLADRLAGFILAGYCAITALLWKPFWKQPDFTLVGKSQGREMFWDFLKNFAVAGGFLMVTFGPNAGSASSFLAAPLSSTRPYSTFAPDASVSPGASHSSSSSSAPATPQS